LVFKFNSLSLFQSEVRFFALLAFFIFDYFTLLIIELNVFTTLFIFEVDFVSFYLTSFDILNIVFDFAFFEVSLSSLHHFLYFLISRPIFSFFQFHNSHIDEGIKL
jgi:hypothetical protein